MYRVTCDWQGKMWAWATEAPHAGAAIVATMEHARELPAGADVFGTWTASRTVHPLELYAERPLLPF